TGGGIGTTTSSKTTERHPPGRVAAAETFLLAFSTAPGIRWGSQLMPDSRPENFSRDVVVALCSETGPGGVVLRQPLSRWQAEALADILSRSAPGRKYWIEELTSLPTEGRVRRVRSPRRRRASRSLDLK